MLPEGMHAVVKKDSYEVPAIFKLMQKKGNIAEEMMYNTFNMGLGMIVAVDPADVDKTMEAIKAAGLNTITPVVICNSDDFSTFKTIIGKDVTSADVVIDLAK